MSEHKKIPQKVRMRLYEQYNHRCAYCGCEMDYKDMQVDHVKSVYAYTDITKRMTEEEMYSEDNLLPACRQCNFYKSSFTLEDFRERLSTSLWNNLRKNFNYRLLIKYGLIEEKPKPIKFYFEKIRDQE